MPKTNYRYGYFSYVKYYLKPILFSLAFVYACYAAMLIFPAMQIDEEIWLTSTNPQTRIRKWISIGRFGLAAIESALGLLNNFNTRAFDFCSVTLYFLSASIYLYAVNPSRKTPGFGVFAFISLYCALPFSVGELISFSMLNVYMGIAAVLVSLALLCAVKNTSLKKPWYFIGAVLFCFCATSCYQSFITVFITGLFAYALFSLNAADADKRKIIIRVSYGAASALAALTLYFLVYKQLIGVWRFGDARLTDNWVGWAGGGDKAYLALKIIWHIVRVLLGYKIYGGAAHLAIFLLFVTVCIISVRRPPHKNVGVRALGMALLMLSPFFMDIALGSKAITGRTFTALAPAFAAEMLFAVIIGGALSKIKKLVICAAVGFCLVWNLICDNVMFYNGHIVYEQDKKTAWQIMEAFANAGIDPYEKPVLFVGAIDAEHLTPEDKPVTGSYFWWDQGNNGRIHNFMELLGYPLASLKRANVNSAYTLADDMPSWPDEGSIKDVGPCVIVKLSEPADIWLSVNGKG